ncbi:hypothetical protein BJV82DRAFT_711346 [Fennellomyces sp. T-0311]|nr:hypothetical protein BJV82DRAFT_711346 [Fennellomyces sp. T-0311]
MFNKQCITIQDNAAIKTALGKYNIVCVEDLPHEVAIVGPAFMQIISPSSRLTQQWLERARAQALYYRRRSRKIPLLTLYEHRSKNLALFKGNPQVFHNDSVK